MKHLATVAAILLGLIFLAASVPYFLNLYPTPELPEGTPIAHFMAAFGPTGYTTFIKVLELIGGVLVAVPPTRRLGLLILGPIVVNIIAFHVFITDGHGMTQPLFLGAVVLSLFLLWAERVSFIAFLRGAPRAQPAKATTAVAAGAA